MRYFLSKNCYLVSKDALERLKDEHPDIYDQYVTVSEWRRFHVKKAALQAA